MSFLSDSRGNTEWFNMGDVSPYEAASSTAFFVASATAFSNFGVTIPTGSSSTVALSDVLASFNVPIAGSAVFTYALTVVLVLLGYQIYDSAQSYGRSNGFDFMDWLNSIPTGLTIVTVGSIVTVISAIFDITAVMSVINSNISYQTLVIVVHTATYWAISSQD